MLTCERSEVLIADALYDTLPAGDKAQLEAHLADCAHCRRLLTELETATDGLTAMGIEAGAHQDIPERASLDSLWARVEPALAAIDSEREKRVARRSVTPFLAGALVTAASLLLFLGLSDVELSVPEPDSELLAGAPPQAISPALMDYLSRVESMLLLVANEEGGGQSLLPIREPFARSMASEASLIDSSMDDVISSGQSRLLKDIEFLLLQIANLDESNMAEGIRLLQDYIVEHSVFLKIRMLEMRDNTVLI